MMASLHGMVVDVEKPVWDFHWLCTMMQKRNRVHLHGIEGIINGIRPEDGSENNWLVTLADGLIKKEVFVRAS